MARLTNLLDSALRTLAMLCLLPGIVMVFTVADDPEHRRTLVLLLLVGGTAAALFAALRYFGAAAKSTSAQNSVFKRPVGQLMKKNLLPNRNEMLGDVAQIVRDQKLLAIEKKAKPAPTRGVHFAMACIIELMAKWKVETIEALSDAQLAQLYFTFRIMCGPQNEIDRLLPLAAKPEPLLKLRDERLKHDTLYDEHAAGRMAHINAINEWEQNGNIPQYHEEDDLVGFLKGVPVRDTDLWHDIARGAEPGWPADEEALYWIAAQPDCGKSTIAAFFATYMNMGHLSEHVEMELKKGSTKLADQIGSIIERWESNFYVGDNYETSDSLSKEVYQAENRKIADLLGRPRWPEPKDLFSSFEGKKTKATYYFAHNMGLMTLPPERPELGAEEK